MTEQSFYVRQDDATLGPYTAEEIQERVRRGDVSSNALVGRGDQWVALDAWRASVSARAVVNPTPKAGPRWQLLVAALAAIVGVGLAVVLLQGRTTEAKEIANTRREATPNHESNVRMLGDDCTIEGPRCSSLYVDRVLRVTGRFRGVDVGSENGLPGEKNRFATLVSDEPDADKAKLVVHCYLATDATSAESTAQQDSTVDVQGVSFGVRMNGFGGGALILAHCRIRH